MDQNQTIKDAMRYERFRGMIFGVIIGFSCTVAWGLTIAFVIWLIRKD